MDLLLKVVLLLSEEELSKSSFASTTNLHQNLICTTRPKNNLHQNQQHTEAPRVNQSDKEEELHTC